MIFFLLGVFCTPAAARVAGSARPPTGDLLDLDWRVYIAAKPIYCILVEKDRQRLRVLRHDGRLQVVAEYAAATGANPGIKEKEGDSKTPEGVYLITKGYRDRKLSVFGKRAFHLNYPNYFDLRAGRGGTGIYIHGTNKALSFNSSNGCVVLKNRDLAQLADFLTVGTPVFIVSSLSSLTEGRGGYPNLTEHDFEGAKALLIPAGAGQADFASLYLIRINGQTVAVGEYWAEPESASPQLTVAYLQGSQGNRWSVVDRGPIGGETGDEALATIDGMPPDLRLQAIDPGEGAGPWPMADLFPWQVSREDLYLSWYRESSQQGPFLVSLTGEEEFDPSPALKARGPREGVVYGLFLLATCLSVGTALVIIRRQSGWRGNSAAREGGPGGKGMVELLRREVKQAQDTLYTVQKRINEEARIVDSLEALQSRVIALEGASQDKQAEIDQLHATQAALKLQGRVEHSGQAELLNALQRELVEIRQRLEEARHDMAEVVEREERVNGQLAEIRRLAEKELVPKDNEALQEVVAICDSLRGQVQAMAEAVQSQSNEITRWQGSTGEAGRRSDEVLETLQSYAAEMKGLQAEMAGLRGGAGASAMEDVLQGLRHDLQAEQAAKLELMNRLGRLSAVEEELAGRSHELEALRKESENRRVEAVTEKMALESTLSAVRHELHAEQAEKAALTSRLARIEALEEELRSRDRENETLHKEREARLSATAAEKEELEKLLASLRGGLQVEQAEKAELASRLARIGELEEELAKRGREHETQRQEHEDRLSAALAEREELETALASARGGLQAEQAEKVELARRLARVGELEAELAKRDREHETQRQEQEARLSAARAEKEELETALASVRGGLQAEQAEKAELARRLARTGELEEELTKRDREHETQRQEHEDRLSVARAEREELEKALASVRGGLQAEQAEKAELASRLARIDELEQELAKRDSEHETPPEEHEARLSAAVAEKEELEKLLASVRGGLQAEQVEKAELVSRLARIGELEEELARRDRENESLRKEREARKLDTVAEKNELESVLSTLRDELHAEQAAKAELAGRLTRIDELEEDLVSRDREQETLRKEQEAWLLAAAEEKEKFESVLSTLRDALRAEQAEKTELAARLTRIGELEEELASRDREQETLHKAQEARLLAAAEEKEKFESVLSSLRDELQAEQAGKAELASRLMRIGELEGELARRNHENETLRKEQEALLAAAAAERKGLETTLAELRDGLQAEQRVQAELNSRLTRIDELEEKLAGQDRELESSRQANKLISADTAAEKSRLEAELAELVLARQIEVANLSNALQEAKDKVAADQERQAVLSRQVETLQEALRQVTEQQAFDQENARAAMQQEIAELKALVAELGKKAAMSEGVVMVKGAHYLPGDVLRKWIGKEQ